jgi:hypothetical protein
MQQNKNLKIGIKMSIVETVTEIKNKVVDAWEQSASEVATDATRKSAQERNENYWKAYKRYEDGEFESVSEGQAVVAVEEKIEKKDFSNLPKALVAIFSKKEKLRLEQEKLEQQEREQHRLSEEWDSLLDRRVHFKKELETLDYNFNGLQDRIQKSHDLIRRFSTSEDYGKLGVTANNLAGLEVLQIQLPKIKEKMLSELRALEQEIQAFAKKHEVPFGGFPD